MEDEEDFCYMCKYWHFEMVPRDVDKKAFESEIEEEIDNFKKVGDVVRECRRYPPHAADNLWPNTGFLNWCGEFSMTHPDTISLRSTFVTEVLERHKTSADNG
ncbi:MAG: hypothetical protein RID91_02510 [Azospirillaceae bacterium]